MKNDVLAYELARLLTCRACNFVVTARMHFNDKGEEYEIIPSVSVQKRGDGTESIILELVPIVSQRQQAENRSNCSDSSQNTGENSEKSRHFHLF